MLVIVHMIKKETLKWCKVIHVHFISLNIVTIKTYSLEIGLSFVNG